MEVQWAFESCLMFRPLLLHGMRQAAQHLENVAGGISSGDFDEALQANTAASEFLVKVHEFVASVDSHPELFG